MATAPSTTADVSPCVCELARPHSSDPGHHHPRIDAGPNHGAMPARSAQSGTLRAAV
jgi:hypothetical protein